MSTGAYAPHGGFVAPALHSTSVPKLVFGVIAVECLFGLGLMALGFVLGTFNNDLAREIFEGATRTGLILQLATFALLIMSLSLVLSRQHDRPLVTALGPPGRAIPAIFAAFTAAGLLFLTIEVLPPWWSRDSISAQANTLAWLLTLPVALAVLLIQTSAEELLYRGYVQQQLAARFRQTWVWLCIPNLLFAMAHWDNGATQTESWQYVIWAFFFGLSASDLTARTGNLGAAIGLHLANNAYAFLLYGEEGGRDSGLALFLYPPIPETTGNMAAGGPVLTTALVIDLAIVWLCWLAVRIAIRR